MVDEEQLVTGFERMMDVGMIMLRDEMEGESRFGGIVEGHRWKKRRRQRRRKILEVVIGNGVEVENVRLVERLGIYRIKISKTRLDQERG